MRKRIFSNNWLIRIIETTLAIDFPRYDNCHVIFGENEMIKFAVKFNRRFAGTKQVTFTEIYHYFLIFVCFDKSY